MAYQHPIFSQAGVQERRAAGADRTALEGQLQARWPEIQALVQNDPALRALSERGGQGWLRLAYTQAAARLGFDIPDDYNVNPNGSLQQKSDLTDFVMNGMGIVGGTLIGGAALGATPAVGGAGGSASVLPSTQIGTGYLPAVGVTGPGTAGAIPAISNSTGPGTNSSSNGGGGGGIPTWLKGLSKVAIPAIGAATIGGQDTASASSEVDKILAAFPQLKELLGMQAQNARQSQPLHEAVKQMALNFLPRSSRSALPGVTDIRGIK